MGQNTFMENNWVLIRKEVGLMCATKYGKSVFEHIVSIVVSAFVFFKNQHEGIFLEGLQAVLKSDQYLRLYVSKSIGNWCDR